MLPQATIYIVGAGPGPADWLTVRAARILADAEAVVHDRLVSQEVLAVIGPQAKLFCAADGGGDPEERQLWILRLIESLAARYRRVVRLKNGDPFVFGRGAEEWAWLVRRGWHVEIIPGISSALSLPAQVGIPPTFRGLSSAFAVVTGCLRAGGEPDWPRYALVDTLIILMGVRGRAEIAAALIRAGRSAMEPCCFIENGGGPQQRLVFGTLGQVAEGRCEVHPPAVWVVGEVVGLRDRLHATSSLVMEWRAELSSFHAPPCHDLLIAAAEAVDTTVSNSVSRSCVK